MSSKKQHFRAGLALGIPLSCGAYFATHNPLISGMILTGSMVGSSAPDWLELAWHTGGDKKKGWFSFGYEEGIRHSIIPHRTITHWYLAWTFLSIFAIAYLLRHQGFIDYFVAAFFISGWLHIRMDSKTSMGVPWFHPWARTRPKIEKEL